MSKQPNYIEVAVAGSAGKQEVFTYHTQEPVPAGSLVSVPFGRRDKVGVVLSKVTKPDFETRPITKTLDLPPLPDKLLELTRWISRHYVTPLPTVLQTVLPPQLAATPRNLQGPHTSIQSPLGVSMVKPTVAQAKALAGLQDAGRPALLHGATGSGKTQLYIELARDTIGQGKSALVLVPEIALTPQMMQQFKAVFGDKVLLTHSGLTPAARRNIWLKVLANPDPVVVIGPRSALFMPFENLGLLVIDECHEATYKQDQAPRYRAPTVAEHLAQLHNAKLVLGSATPAVEQMYLAQAGKFTLVSLPTQIHTGQRSQPQVVDLRDKSNFGASRLLSRPLLAALRDTLARGAQSILFINRRGSARLTICRDCSWSATCPKCQIPLTFHADKGRLVCHWCGFTQQPPASCPECGKSNIIFVGGGTKRLEQEVARLVPEARLARLDSDSVTSGDLGTVLEQMRASKADILIGTQLVAKGLDLPKVETVGVVLADQSLYLPDFTATERTYQLLHQVSGRAGRAHGANPLTIIQTYAGGHPVLKAAVAGEFTEFVKSELEERQAHGYPPFVFLLKLSAAYKTRSGARRAGQKLADQIRHSSTLDPQPSTLKVLGPAPAWQETLRGKYHWQVIIKSKHRAELVKIARSVPQNWMADLDPINLL